MVNCIPAALTLTSESQTTCNGLYGENLHTNSTSLLTFKEEIKTKKLFQCQHKIYLQKKDKDAGGSRLSS
jgi:hypothetical protein